MDQHNTKYNFSDLVKKSLIRIPKIQRDYVEGRHNPKVDEIRTSFINSILHTVQTGNPIELDFVYGYDKLNGSKSKMEPLDGQQRLTTLFLFYWLLDYKEEDKSILIKDGESVFTYETRISSEEFTNALVTHPAPDLFDKWNAKNSSVFSKEYDSLKEIFLKEHTQTSADIEANGNETTDYETDTNGAKSQIPDNENIILIKKSLKESALIKFSEYLISLGWFQWTWKTDPTVKSMLNVFDTFFEQLFTLCKSQKEGDNIYKDYFDNLSNFYKTFRDNSANLNNIKFELLNLENFNLGNDLFVKMNARGKELSLFDKLKSTLEEEIQHQNRKDIESDWRKYMDSDWIDYFWCHRDQSKFTNSSTDVNSTGDKSMSPKFQEVEKIENRFRKFLLFLISIQYFREDIKDNFVQLCYENNDNIFNIIKEYKRLSWEHRNISKNTNFQEINFNQILSDFNCFIYNDGSSWKDATELFDFHWEPENPISLINSFLESNDFTRDKQLGLYAVIAFCRKFSAKKISENTSLLAVFKDWLYFVRNCYISRNTNEQIDKISIEQNAIIMVDKWLDNFHTKFPSPSSGKEMKEFIANLTYNKGDSVEKDRLDDEKLKASLMLDATNDTNWCSIFEKANNHYYLCGQVCLLLKWSEKVSGSYDYSEFLKYYNAASSIFPSQKTDDSNLEDLLAKAVIINKNSSDFIKNGCYLYRYNFHRDYSWKRYLREKHNGDLLKSVIDDWILSGDPDFSNYVNGLSLNPAANIWQTIVFSHFDVFKNNSPHRILVENKKIGHFFFALGSTPNSRMREVGLCFLYQNIAKQKAPKYWRYDSTDANQNEVKFCTEYDKNAVNTFYAFGLDTNNSGKYVFRVSKEQNNVYLKKLKSSDNLDFNAVLSEFNTIFNTSLSL